MGELERKGGVEGMNDQAMENLIREKGLNAPRVTYDHIAAILEDVTYHFHQIPGTTVTLAVAFTADGFMLAVGTSAAVSLENFDADIGREIARDNAQKLAKDKLWELEGYSLKKKLFA